LLPGVQSGADIENLRKHRALHVGSRVRVLNLLANATRYDDLQPP
jgi:hypothetical protein